MLADADPELRAEVEKLLAQDSGGKILDIAAAELLGTSFQHLKRPKLRSLWLAS